MFISWLRTEFKNKKINKDMFVIKIIIFILLIFLK